MQLNTVQPQAKWITLLLSLCFLTAACGKDERSMSEIESVPSEQPVDPDQIQEHLKKADRIKVLEEPIEGSPVLYESTKREDINALATALKTSAPEEPFHCMCIGTPAIYLYKGDELLLTLTNHHAFSVRCSLWESDAPILDIDGWLAWFDERQLDGPREEYEEGLARHEASRNAYKRWIDAIPEGMKDAWENAPRDFVGQVEAEPLLEALTESISDQNAQILALYNWYGSGEGPWSGFPSYESTAEDLLLTYDTQALITAIEVETMTTAQIEGAARLFGGWDFSQKRPGDSERLPAQVKAAFWKHVSTTSDDEDKLGRAERAFK